MNQTANAIQVHNKVHLIPEKKVHFSKYKITFADDTIKNMSMFRQPELYN